MTEHHVPFSLKKLEEALANGAHSIFSASGSHMWAWCSGSLIPNLLAEDNSGYEAAEGTVAHGVAELWLKTGKKPRHLLNTVEIVTRGDEKFEVTIDDVMTDHVQRYVDWCWSLDGDSYTERKVYYSELTPIQKQGGTMDHASARRHHLTITDLKYGKGVQIYAESNSQLMLYAYGMFMELDFIYDFQDILIRVAQPRFNHFDEVLITRQELLDFAEWIKGRAHAAWVIDAPRTPGVKQCQFCKVKATCGAHIAFQDSLMDGIFQDLTQPVTTDKIEIVKDRIDWMQPFKSHTPVAELTTAQMSVLYGYKGFVDSWWKALNTELMKRAAKGEHIPLQKLVEGRTHRTYGNHKKAVQYLVEELDIPQDEVVIESLVSPAELEKIMVKHGYKRSTLPALLEPVVVKPPGKPSLVSIADKRPALRELDDDVYQDLTKPKPETFEDEEL